MMFPQRRWRIGIAAVVTVFGVVAPVLDRFVFPEGNPPAWAYPVEGQVFHSQEEGFSQRIVKIDDDLVWSESLPVGSLRQRRSHDLLVNQGGCTRSNVGFSKGDLSGSPLVCTATTPRASRPPAVNPNTYLSHPLGNGTRVGRPRMGPT